MQRNLRVGREPAALALDNTDLRIVDLLSRDARLSARAISRQIGMSPGAVAERIERLQDHGVITGYRAEIDPGLLGYGMVAIVGLRTRQGPALSGILERLIAIPEVAAAHMVTGHWDLLLELYVRDHLHLRDVLIEKIWHIDDFRQSETMISLRVLRPEGGWVPPPVAAAGRRGGDF